MVSSRALTAVVGLGVSLFVSVAAWAYFDTLLVFLVVPFVPLLFRRRATGESEDRADGRVCPACGFRSRDPSVAYCPRDGTRLEPGDRRSP
ncbi:hypothetical protein ACFO0N_11370 [Halobium salinum]|uniref:Zinc ribbon domain-containing protein n=1 Tax=Halobium salinum TaxID=1364940 RepID=A0ABD5PD19_9EURY|nr:hypothetical protein [Halobium salinum]